MNMKRLKNKVAEKSRTRSKLKAAIDLVDQVRSDVIPSQESSDLTSAYYNLQDIHYRLEKNDADSLSSKS